jgi:hypothetical protein
LREDKGRDLKEIKNGFHSVGRLFPYSETDLVVGIAPFQSRGFVILSEDERL